MKGLVSRLVITIFISVLELVLIRDTFHLEGHQIAGITFPIYLITLCAVNSIRDKRD